MSLTSKLIDWTERGWMPDPLLRRGIRYLCKKRLRNVDLGDKEANETAKSKLIEKISHGPVAHLPEKANEQHYEVPAALYELVLGARRKYSCCYFENGNETLDEAETAALDITCERAEIQNGQDILELGCGWGSLTLWMAEKYPECRITAVSNSNSQREYILAQAEATGVGKNLNVITCDMNDFEISKRFDRIVSVEMFEHMRNYRVLLKRISCWLKPDGKLFVHIFCHRELSYEFNDNSDDDWMSRYFFSGGIMPSEDLFSRFSEDMRVVEQWRWNGRHYHLTSEAWIKNMDQRKKEIIPILASTYGGADAERWFNRWRMFYLACSELFGYQKGEQWWVAHYLFGKQFVSGNASQQSKRGNSTLKA